MRDNVLWRLAQALGRSCGLDREDVLPQHVAHDLKHDRDVAIKVLHPDLGGRIQPIGSCSRTRKHLARRC